MSSFELFHKKILPPVELIEKCKNLAVDSTAIEHHVLGKSDKGHDIDAFSFGNGKRSVFFYGFPDPGEAIGGTIILNILENASRGHAILDNDLTWWLIPVLNFDDQPDEGRSLQHVMRDESIRDVDWCVDNPRPETRALLSLSKTIRPIFTFALHDEYHSGEAIPAYFGFANEPAVDVIDHLRNILSEQSIPVNRDFSSESLGPGAFLIPDYAGDDYEVSTFKKLAGYGQVFVFELSHLSHVTDETLIEVQWMASKVLIESIA